MKKVLILTQWSNDATYYYRLQPLFRINHPKITVHTKPYFGEISYSYFDSYTHVILERPSSTNDLYVIKLAKQSGKKVIADFDDDCLHVDAYNPMHHTYESNKAVMIECIAEADEVWVSTKSLKQAYRMINKNIVVVPNSHNDYLQPVTNKKSFNRDTKKALWRGGESHEADVYENSEHWVSLMAENKDWVFYWVGCRFIWMEQRSGANYQPVSMMPLMQYFDFLREQNPNIMFHPLSNTVFNNSKSNIAWLEATYAGAAFFGNKSLPEFDKDCILPIEQLLEGDLEKANKESWELICDTLLLSKVNELRIERLLA